MLVTPLKPCCTWGRVLALEARYEGQLQAARGWSPLAAQLPIRSSFLLAAFTEPLRICCCTQSAPQPIGSVEAVVVASSVVCTQQKGWQQHHPTQQSVQCWTLIIRKSTITQEISILTNTNWFYIVCSPVQMGLVWLICDCSTVCQSICKKVNLIETVIVCWIFRRAFLLNYFEQLWAAAFVVCDRGREGTTSKLFQQMLFHMAAGIVCDIGNA